MPNLNLNSFQGTNKTPSLALRSRRDSHVGSKNTHVVIHDTNGEKWEPFDSIMSTDSVTRQQNQASADDKLLPLIQNQIKEFKTLKQLEETLSQ